ncbi:MAG: putative transcription antitermination protein [Genomoviridae sp.]|nr:MAG: putative transcription antitermination protein [Genomoviridae sp.]
MSSIPNIITTKQCPACNAHFKTKVCKVIDYTTNTDAWYVTIEMDREQIQKWFKHDSGIRVPLMYTTLKAQDEVNAQFLESLMSHASPEYEV